MNGEDRTAETAQALSKSMKKKEYTGNWELGYAGYYVLDAAIQFASPELYNGDIKICYDKMYKCIDNFFNGSH